MALLATTKLEAINTLLGAIGEAPVNSVNSGLVDAETAEKIIDETSREVQSQGWSFNTDFERSFTPDGTNQFPLPTNILRIEMAEQRTRTFDVVARGHKIYDRVNSTFYFAPSVTSIKMNVVVYLDFEDLPEAARRYITIRSARIFQDRVVGSNELHAFQQRDELVALVELKDADSNVNDNNIFDNYGVSSILDRLGGRVL
jgi:hypothetical protein